MPRRRKSKKRSSTQRDLQSKPLPRKKTVLRRSYEMPFKVAFAIKFKRRLRDDEPGNALIDGRMFDPTGPVARTIDGRLSRIRYARPEGRSRRRPVDYFSNKIRFESPKRVEVCRRRTKRRRALFANQKAGNGRRITTRKKRNEFSEIKC